MGKLGTGITPPTIAFLATLDRTGVSSTNVRPAFDCARFKAAAVFLADSSPSPFFLPAVEASSLALAFLPAGLKERDMLTSRVNARLVGAATLPTLTLRLRFSSASETESERERERVWLSVEDVLDLREGGFLEEAEDGAGEERRDELSSLGM